MNNDNKTALEISAILIILTLFGIGLYFFLSYAKNNVKKFKLENKTVEVGEPLSTNIKDYIEKINKNCKLDISEVNVNKVGKYNYYVRCKKEVLKATIEVVDKK